MIISSHISSTLPKRPLPGPYTSSRSSTPRNYLYRSSGIGIVITKDFTKVYTVFDTFIESMLDQFNTFNICLIFYDSGIKNDLQQISMISIELNQFCLNHMQLSDKVMLLAPSVIIYRISSGS